MWAWRRREAKGAVLGTCLAGDFSCRPWQIPWGAAARFALETGLSFGPGYPLEQGQKGGGRENRVGVYMATVQGQKRRAKPDDACLRRRLSVSEGAAEPARPGPCSLRSGPWLTD
jgi:hypothetical protein